MSKTGTEYSQSFEKRALDVAVASLAAPAMATMALWLVPGMRRENGPGIFFRQERIGSGERVNLEQGVIEPDMTIVKFKSMPDGNRSQVSTTGVNHPDAGPISTLARSLRVDEAPQLLSVMRGKMSVVGLRPRTTEDVEQIMDVLSPKEQREWLLARNTTNAGLAHPGATDQYKKNYSYNQREIAGSEIEYANNASLLGDLRILGGIASGLVSTIERKFKLDSLEDSVIDRF